MISNTVTLRINGTKLWGQRQCRLADGNWGHMFRVFPTFCGKSGWSIITRRQSSSPHRGAKEFGKTASRLSGAIWYPDRKAQRRLGSLPDIEIAVFPEFRKSLCEWFDLFLGSVIQLTHSLEGDMYSWEQFLNHPFSRGTIVIFPFFPKLTAILCWYIFLCIQHAVSDDPMEQPEFDAHNFENDFGVPNPDSRGDASVDLEMMVQNVRSIRSLTEIEPWNSAIALEVDPRPNYTSDEGIRSQSIVLPMQWHSSIIIHPRIYQEYMRDILVRSFRCSHLHGQFTPLAQAHCRLLFHAPARKARRCWSWIKRNLIAQIWCAR